MEGLSMMYCESEGYSQHGSMSASGVSRLLGKPKMPPLELVIRETVQNAWDARVETLEEPLKPLMRPEFHVRIRTLSVEEFAFLREEVFRELPPKERSHPMISDVLSGTSLQVMEISDYGTVGLGGPVDPRVPPGDRCTDYVDFIRNLGSPRDTELGGGTYGYGKSSLYRFSKCHTILIDTYPVEDQERRFTAHNLGDPHDIEDGPHKGRYTGRHWWGTKEGGPVTGQEAERIAAALGLPERGPDRTGTTLMILAPRFGDDEEDVETEDAEFSGIPVHQQVHEYLLWNFWPKMISDGGEPPPMRFQISSDGINYPVFPPERVAPLHLYVEAMRVLKAGEAEDIRCRKPKKFLGRLSLKSGPVSSRLAGLSPRFRKASHHVALMRPAELVVTYLPCAAHPDPEVEWGGVFICSDNKQVEKAFADSEPPAHDDWSPESLPKGWGQTFVRVALRNIKSRSRDAFAGSVQNTKTEHVDGGGLGRLARSLGKSLLTVVGAEGGRRLTTSSMRGARSRSKKSARGLSPTLLTLTRDNSTAVTSTWKIALEGACRPGDKLIADLGFAMAGGGRAAELLTMGEIEVLGWYSSAGKLLSREKFAVLNEPLSEVQLKLKYSHEVALHLRVVVEQAAVSEEGQ
ncbi:hypothetical protein FRC96_07930 [Lujinxingia vulgaris]|uniref:Uncharacterized protein n=1 Tax=Lujinxingia vulgaris TaxID=2600176 RepID=A0A5C6XDU4_9DELT|nr:hypothetical protein [Lujinxingia vulgaris]TXD37963.1 hypothetical protein FRC96_07930 [Lujinxingia vulgaris]